MQPNDASYTNHSLYTVYFILFRSYSFQLDCRLFAAVNTRQDEAFFLYFFFFFQIGYDLYVYSERNGRWLVTHNSQVFFFFFSEKKKNKRGDACFVCCPHWHCLTERTIKRRRVTNGQSKERNIFFPIFISNKKFHLFSSYFFFPFQRVVSVFLFSLTR